MKQRTITRGVSTERFQAVRKEIELAPACHVRGFQTHVSRKSGKTQQAVYMVLSGKSQSELISKFVVTLWPKWLASKVSSHAA
jgi:hypothetical protein